MHRWRSSWGWPILVVLVATVVALGARFGHTKGTGGPVWTEQPVDVPGRLEPRPAWVELAKALKPAVVNISTKRVERASAEPSRGLEGDNPFEQFFRQFFGNLPPHLVRSLGSGFVINPAGYLVTNNHVVDGATEIRVKLADGREFPAQVVGRDTGTDLALLKIEVTGLPVIPLGDSSRLQVGEPVMAIGNPFGLEETVTTGIVSATGRVIGEGPYDDFIQTDASINPGNSGGPLINARGQAVGINAAIFSQSGGSVGIGFAIPINLAKPVITQLASTGHVIRGWLGVGIQPVTPELARSLHLPEPSGALVASVADRSPAAAAGLRPGDVITRYDGRPIARSDALPRAVAETAIGREVALTVVRDGKTERLTARIAKLAEPDQQAAKASEETPSLGLIVEPLTPARARELELDETRGLLVRGVEAAGVAAGAGIRTGDVIVEVDHEPVRTVADMRRLVTGHQSATPILMLLHRGGAARFVAVAGEASAGREGRR